MTTYYINNNPHAIQNQNSTIVLNNDQSTIKGALWAFVAFKTGMATLGFAATALVTSPMLVLPPLTGVPVVTGIAALIGYSITSGCIDNATYHLESRKIVVLQNR